MALELRGFSATFPRFENREFSGENRERQTNLQARSSPQCTGALERSSSRTTSGLRINTGASVALTAEWDSEEAIQSRARTNSRLSSRVRNYGHVSSIGWLFMRPGGCDVAAIVAVALLTEPELQALGSAFDRAWPIDDSP